MAADDDQDIPESGAVFTFGKSKFAENVPSKFWIRNDHFLQVACGDEHTALIAASGRIFTFGSNDWGQLGVGTKKASSKPTCIKSLKGEKGKLVACGKNHTIVTTAQGRLYSFGANNEGQLGTECDEALTPMAVDSLDETDYKMIAAGSEHSVALTGDGRVFIWGGGSEGQLGLGEDRTESREPVELEMKRRVTCVACGYYHTAIVTDDGKLYTFGEKDCGKLGLGEDIDDNYTPQHVSYIREKVKSVACGGSHTAVLTGKQMMQAAAVEFWMTSGPQKPTVHQSSEDGKVYTFGDGNNGQLGHGNTILQSSTPQVVNSLINTKIQQVYCGENHTAVLTEKGQLLTFGDGRHGKLGLGEENFANQFRPFKVSRFAKFHVDTIACGGCHMLALAKKSLENGDMMSSGEDEVEGPRESMRLSASLRASTEDGEFTITPRGRRHKDSDRSPMLNRTLPALKSTMKPLSPLAATIPGDKAPRPLARARLPQLSKEEPPMIRRHPDSEEEESDEDNEAVNRPQPLARQRKPLVDDEMIEEETIAAVAAAPVAAAPALLAPIPTKRKEVSLEREEESDDENEEEEESEEEEHLTAKQKAKLKKEKEKAEKKKKGKDKGKGKHKDEDSEADEDEDSEEETSKKKDKNKKKKGKEKDKKKKKGIFGKKKGYDSEEESEEEEDEEEDSEEETSKKKKKSKSKKEDKKKKDKKKKKPESEEEEEEDEDSEEEEERLNKEKDKKSAKNKEKEDKKKGKDKKDKKGKEEKDDKEGSDKEGSDKKGSDNEDKGESKEGDKEKTEEKKDEKKDETPPPPKKSKLCTIL